MATEAQSTMLGLLPPDLSAVAVDLSEIAGSREYCFPLAVAPAVLENLLMNGATVLGGDLWDLENDEYCPSAESWYVDTVDGESVESRNTRVSAIAAAFFVRYATATDKRITFVVKPEPAAS